MNNFSDIIFTTKIINIAKFYNYFNDINDGCYALELLEPTEILVSDQPLAPQKVYESILSLVEAFFSPGQHSPGYLFHDFAKLIVRKIDLVTFAVQEFSSASCCISYVCKGLITRSGYNIFLEFDAIRAVGVRDT